MVVLSEVRSAEAMSHTGIDGGPLDGATGIFGVDLQD